MAGSVLVFSPPGKPGEPKVEVAVLHLQPFADAPQVVFEEVPVGREAVRQLRVVNPSSSEQLVKLSGPLSQKGFAADHETFVVPAKQEQMVNFTWKPDDGKEPASRVVLTVTSDRGFRGRCTLLGMVKPPPAKLALTTPKKLPAPKILTASQRLNTVRTAPASTKPCAKAAPPPKPTVPKEFVTHSKKSLASASGASSSKVVGTAKASRVERPCRKAASTTKETQPRQPASEPEPAQETRRDTFDRDTAPVAAKENEEPAGDAETLEVPGESTSEAAKEDSLPGPSSKQSGAATERKGQKRQHSPSTSQ